MTKHQGCLELTWTDKNKALLSTGDGKYDYAFVDPSDYRVSEVRLLHEVERVEVEIPAGRPDELPVPTTDNLLITGDAMHVLDALAKIPEYADKYVGQVKLVYIDPPFNTGQAFSNYEDNIEHSIWLTMLRDRLRQIKPLLADDGSVWVHLDHAESHRCRVVLDEEFGPDNFAAEVAWQKADALETTRRACRPRRTRSSSIGRPNAGVQTGCSAWPRPTRRATSRATVIRSPGGTAMPRLGKRQPTTRWCTPCNTRLRAH